MPCLSDLHCLLAPRCSSTNHQAYRDSSACTSRRTKDVVGLTAPKLDVVRVGFIGLGMRGPGAVERFTHIPGTQIVALCDLIPERVAGAQKILTKASLPEAASYSGSEDAWKNFANVTISTSFTSRLTGNITHRWLSTPWNTASTLPSKFLRQ